MKNYIVTDKDGNFKNIKKSYKPKRDFIGETPIDELTGKPEDARWLQLENIDDGFGNLVPTLTVNETLKATLQAQDAQTKSDGDAAKAAEKAKQEGLVDKLIAFDPDAINNIADIRQAFKDLKEYFDLKYKVEIDKKKGKL